MRTDPYLAEQRRVGAALERIAACYEAAAKNDARRTACTERQTGMLTGLAQTLQDQLSRMGMPAEPPAVPFDFSGSARPPEKKKKKKRKGGGA